MKAGVGFLTIGLFSLFSPAYTSYAESVTGSSWIEPVTGMEFVRISGGCFQMGANENATEKPPHKVCVKTFWLGRHEVTQHEYKQLAGNDPSYFRGDDRPVEQVNWGESNLFAQQLSIKNGRQMRLPSEAEWEYACRAGGQHTEYCGQNQASDLGWYASNSNTQTHPVGEKLPNAWGISDMSGNVWEWVQDCWHDNYTMAPADGTAWEAKENCNQRIYRGGGWFDSLPFLHATYRNKYAPTSRFFYLGFRLVMVQE